MSTQHRITAGRTSSKVVALRSNELAIRKPATAIDFALSPRRHASGADVIDATFIEEPAEYRAQTPAVVSRGIGRTLLATAGVLLALSQLPGGNHKKDTGVTPLKTSAAPEAAQAIPLNSVAALAAEHNQVRETVQVDDGPATLAARDVIPAVLNQTTTARDTIINYIDQQHPDGEQPGQAVYLPPEIVNSSAMPHNSTTQPQTPVTFTSPK